MSQPVERRQRLWLEMMELGWAIVSSSIRKQHPEYTEAEFRAALFERLHKRDIPADQFEKIKEWILNR